MHVLNAFTHFAYTVFSQSTVYYTVSLTSGTAPVTRAVFVRYVGFLLILYVVVVAVDREAGRHVFEFVICIGPTRITYHVGHM